MCQSAWCAATYAVCALAASPTVRGGRGPCSQGNGVCARCHAHCCREVSTWQLLSLRGPTSAMAEDLHILNGRSCGDQTHQLCGNGLGIEVRGASAVAVAQARALRKARRVHAALPCAYTQQLTHATPRLFEQTTRTSHRQPAKPSPRSPPAHSFSQAATRALFAGLPLPALNAAAQRPRTRPAGHRPRWTQRIRRLPRPRPLASRPACQVAAAAAPFEGSVTSSSRLLRCSYSARVTLTPLPSTILAGLGATR